MAPQVTVYTLPTCPHCRQAKEYLTQKGVPYREFNVQKDEQARNEMVALSGGTSVPVMKIGSEVIVGFGGSVNLAKIDAALQKP